jgi:hypothetical protein
MKKLVVIGIEVDTDKPLFDGSMGATKAMVVPPELKAQLAKQGMPALEAYRVKIGKSTRTGQDPLTITAHEIGHILSGVFEVPGGLKDDPRAKGEIHCNCPRCATPDQQRGIWNSEKMAWEIARKITPNLNEQDEKQSLASYREGYEKAIDEYN